MPCKHNTGSLAPVSEDSEKAKLTQLYKQYSRALIEGLRSVYGSGPPEPEDIAQRAFERLASQAKLAEIEDIEGYLWVMARNIVISDKRAEQVRSKNTHEVATRFFGERSEAFDPQRVFMAREDLDIVASALAEMPARRRDIFLLNRVHGLSIKDAGQRCGVSQTAAHRHIGVAMAQIAAAIERASRERYTESDE
ncbi:MAG: RNA polymerase sigma factor [Pseudomonadota bacterium]